MHEKLLTAWKLAGEYHGDQKYGDELPYLYHLGQVYLNAQLMKAGDPELNEELLFCCAILHDILEDTKLEESVLEEAFGSTILEGIKALTKNEGLSTKEEQMRDSLERIERQPREIAVVKICDRISNLSRQPPSWWDKEKVGRYIHEARLIQQRLGASSEVAAMALEKMIAAYARQYG